MQLHLKRMIAMLIAITTMLSCVVPAGAADSVQSAQSQAESVETSEVTLQQTVEEQTGLAPEALAEETATQEIEEPQVQAQEALTAPELPGYTLYTQDTLDPNRQYLIVSQDGKGENKGQAYALYLSQKGTSISPGALNHDNEGAVTAKLNGNGETITADYLNNAQSLDVSHLLLQVQAVNGGYTFYNQAEKLYLNLNATMASTQQAVFSVTKVNENQWQIKETNGRILAFNVYGDGSLTANKYTANATDFWGPKAQESYPIYLYTKNAEDTDTMYIAGYQQINESSVPDGEYVIAAQNETGIQILNADAQGNAVTASCDLGGNLQNLQEALEAGVLSLTNTEKGVYLSVKSQDSILYLSIKNGVVFASDAPQLLQLQYENGAYTLKHGNESLTLSDNGYGVGQAVQLRLYQKQSNYTLSQTNLVLEKGFGANITLAEPMTWLYTDANGAHEPTLSALVTNGESVISVEGSWVQAVAQQGNATIKVVLAYGDRQKTLGDVAVTVQERAAAPNGTTKEQPFIHGETGPSDYFRIPSLTTLENGWLLAASDIRWKTTADSPQNLDTVVSLSKDGGTTWQYEVVNYFDDMADTATGQESASFIDPSIVQGQDGTIYMAVDACPSYVGLMWGNRMGHESSGFDEQGRLLIAKSSANGDAPTALSAYQWYVDLNAQPVKVSVEGETLNLYPVVQKDGTQTGTWVDAYLNVYEWNGTDTQVSKVMCKQMNSNQETWVQNNLFYRQSEWKVYPVFYIMTRTATVEDDGLVWNAPKFLDIKLTETEAFTGVCPGVGVTTTVNGKERIVFPVYDNATGNELASVIYSDDQGATWHRGQHADQLNGTGKSSESQIVTLPNGTLRMYSRNTIGKIGYADSTDGGVTWGVYHADDALTYTSNCMVSFVNAEGYVWNQQGDLYGNLILASYPRNGSRTDGVIRIGSVNESTGEVIWLNEDTVRYPNKYQYSCLTQISGNQLGLLFETQDQEWAPGWGHIFYETLSISDVLGQGWSYTKTKPQSLPNASIQLSNAELMVGDTATMEVVLENVEKNASVQWQVNGDDETVAPVALASAQGEKTELKAENTGRATVTATITAEVNGEPITLVRSVRVFVSDENTVVLPDRYNTNSVSETSRYQQYVDELKNGEYVIYAKESGRILYHQSGKTTTDQVTPDSQQKDEIVLSSGYPISRQMWKISKAEGGYTIQSQDEPGKYLSVNGAGNAQLPISSTPTVFTAEITESGTIVLSAVVNGTTYYLNHSGKFGASTQKGTGFAFYALNQEYNLSLQGLQQLVDETKQLEEPHYTTASWQTLQQALQQAKTALEQPLVYGNQTEADTAYQQAEQATKMLYCAVKNLQLVQLPTPTQQPQPSAAPTPTQQPAQTPTATPTKPQEGSMILEKQELTQVPESLKQVGITTVAQIQQAFFNAVKQNWGQVDANHMQLFDLNLYQADYNGNWQMVGEEEMLAKGVLIELPYPEGVDKNGCDFIIAHMITTGKRAGQVELLKTEKSEHGLRAMATAFSPYAVMWKQSSVTQPTTTPTPTQQPSTAVEPTVTPVPVTSNVNSPVTGDFSVIPMFAAIAAMAGLGFVLLGKRKKKEQ